ncbi:MAG: helix-turn-helix domain-containing protein [Hyphomicrobium sp.]
MLQMSKFAGKDERQARLTGTQSKAKDEPPDVAANLRRLRHDRGHSLETLARLSGVSRAMLGQIETGKSVPTITLIWKVAKALGVPATTLIAAPVHVQACVIPKTSVHTVSTGSGRYQIRTFARTDFPQPFEFGEIRIAEGHREDIVPFPFGARATLLITSGALDVHIGDEPLRRIAEGSAILFQADVAHAFFNAGPGDATAILIVAPQRHGGV